MMKPPMDSPWGQVDGCDELCPGVYAVSTPSHGGIMVRCDIADRILSEEARKCGIKDQFYICFEEDCDEAVAIRELMDRGVYQAPADEYAEPGEYEAAIDSFLQTFYPEYWAAREKMMEAGRNGFQKTKNRKEPER